jgi:lysozyme|tara:strand:- start:1519 stop:1965 length:447 start_codon:yes stop_codon:yes gene_type:complete
MKINEDGLDIIKHYEGYSSSVYLCPAARFTIGWGSTWDHNGNPIKKDQPDISKGYAHRLLVRELRHVEHAISRLVSAELTENMYSATSSLVYNIGSGNFQSSTLRMKLNRGNYEGAADEFPKWRKAGGRILAGLVRRRQSERDLFLAL